MARLNVYLPDDLAAQAKDAGVNVSAVTQEAIRQVLVARSTDSWLSTLPAPAEVVSHDRAMEALDDARDEPATRHG
jgi:post-segregation antitoxin (ccd killing protein)